MLLVDALAHSVPGAARPEAPAPGAEPARPATALGSEVPRGAMARFLAACREGHYARAAEYLNLRQLPQSVRAHRGPELARELETVLDRALWVDLDRLSDQPEGDPEDGLPALRDSLGTIETATGPVEVLIERVSQPGGPPVWKIAASTVAAIPALYDEFGWGPLAKVLPAPFFQLRFLHIRLWQWIGLVLLVAAAWLAAQLLGRVVVALAPRRPAGRPALAQGLRRGGCVHRGVAELRVQRDRPHRGPRRRWSRSGAGGAEDGREPLRQREPGRGSAGAAGRRLPLRRHGRDGRGHRAPLDPGAHRGPHAGHHPERAVLDARAREPEPARPHPRARHAHAAPGHERGAGATGARRAAGDDRLTSQGARRVGARALRPHGAADARDRAVRVRAHDELGRVRRDPGTDLAARPGGGGRRRGAQVIRGRVLSTPGSTAGNCVPATF